MLKIVGVGKSHFADYVKSISSPDIEMEQITPHVYSFPASGAATRPWCSLAKALCSSTPHSGSPVGADDRFCQGEMRRYQVWWSTRSPTSTTSLVTPI